MKLCYQAPSRRFRRHQTCQNDKLPPLDMAFSFATARNGPIFKTLKQNPARLRGHMDTKGTRHVTVANSKQRPIRLAVNDKRAVRTQFGALCYRIHDGKVEILLVTTRRSGRWIIPKGWPMDGETPAGAAATEAWEEAGVTGKLSHHVLGFYAYDKGYAGDRMPCVVAVFPLKVKKVAKQFPERSQRRRKWVSLKKAAGMVTEPELRAMIKAFDPRTLR